MMSIVLPDSLVFSCLNVVVDVMMSTPTCEFHPLPCCDMRGRPHIEVA